MKTMFRDVAHSELFLYDCLFDGKSYKENICFLNPNINLRNKLIFRLNTCLGWLLVLFIISSYMINNFNVF